MSEQFLCMAPLRDSSASELTLCLVPPLSQHLLCDTFVTEEISPCRQLFCFP